DAAGGTVVNRVFVTAGEWVRLTRVDVDLRLRLTDQGVVRDRASEARAAQVDADATPPDDVTNDRQAGLALDGHVDPDIEVVEAVGHDREPLHGHASSPDLDDEGTRGRRDDGDRRPAAGLQREAVRQDHEILVVRARADLDRV